MASCRYIVSGSADAAYACKPSSLGELSGNIVSRQNISLISRALFSSAIVAKVSLSTGFLNLVERLSGGRVSWFSFETDSVSPSFSFEAKGHLVSKEYFVDR